MITCVKTLNRSIFCVRKKKMVKAVSSLVGGLFVIKYDDQGDQSGSCKAAGGGL